MNEWDEKYGWRKRCGFRHLEADPYVDESLEKEALERGYFVRFSMDPHGLFECGPFEMSDDGRPALPDHDRAEAELTKELEGSLQ